MSIRLSAWNNSDPNGRIFIKFDMWVFSESFVEGIQASLKYDKNIGYFTWRQTYIFYHISLSAP